MKFKAAILCQVKKPLVIDTIETNKLLEGQVLVKVNQSGICRSQIFEIDGERGEDKWLPHLLGHEALGIVVDTGPNVSTVKEGDHVVLSWIQSGGINAEPAVYKWGNEIINSGRVTTFSEYSICSENRCCKVSKDLSEKVGPSLGCALPTGYGISLTLEKIKEASFVAVLGLGGIGMSALLGVLNETSAKVICIDLDSKRLQQAKELGSHYIINPIEISNLYSEVIKITNNKLIDVLIESSGSIQALSNSLKLINNNGIVKFVSHPKFGDLLTIDPFELILGKKIEGSWGGGVSPDNHFHTIASKVSNNKLFTDIFSKKSYSLDQINDAIIDMKSLKVLRPIIEMK
mgnify:CR=1 FL=1